MIVVDESEPVGEIEPPFESRDVQIRRGLNVRDFYEMEEEIGRGKFGTVFKCREKKTGLRLAAKFVQAAKKADRINVEREVEIMKSLRNPRLIQLYDAFDDGKKEICLLLELIEGGELFERVIDDDFVLTERACAIFMRQICEGIQFIHLQHVLHLDMKPENILCLTRAGNRIKLIDFGLARRYDPSKKLQVLFGTPEFVAPEVVNFDLIGYGTDMWSVGIIGYVLLSGLSPFMGETDVETMANVTIAKYDFDDEAFNDVSAEAKDFISKLLVKQISKRMTSTESLRHPWLRPRPPLPTPTPSAQQEKQPSSTSNTSSPSPTSSILPLLPTETVPIVSNISSVPEAVVVMESIVMATASNTESDKPSTLGLSNQITTLSSNEQDQLEIVKPMNMETKPDVSDVELAKSSTSSSSNQVMPLLKNKNVQSDQQVPAPEVISSITLPEAVGVKQDDSSTLLHLTKESEALPSSALNNEKLPTSLTAEVKDLITQPIVSDVQPTKSSVPSHKPIPQSLNLDNLSAVSTMPVADFPDILQVAKVNLRQFVERWNSHPNSPFQLNSDSPRRTISLLISNSPSQLDGSLALQPDASPTSLTGMSPSPPCSMPTSPVVKNQPTETLLLDTESDTSREMINREIVYTENQSNHSDIVETNGTASNNPVAQSEASSTNTTVETAIEQTSALLKSVKDSLIRQMESGTAVRDRTGARVWDRKGGSPAPTSFVQHRRTPQVASVFTYAVQKFESKQSKQPIVSKFRQPQEPKPQKPHHQPPQPNEPVGNIEDWEVHPPVEARSFLPKINKQINKYTISTSSCSMNNSSTTIIKMESHKP